MAHCHCLHRLQPGDCHGTQVDSFEREVMEMVKPAHGTTTLGFIYDGGVVIAVDSRASMGSYICEPSAAAVWHHLAHVRLLCDGT